MNHLRGDRGLNYGDYSYIEKFTGGLGSTSTFPNPNTPLRQQYFSIWLRPVQPENAHFAVRDALYELRKLVDTGISPADFDATKKFLLSYSKLWVSTASRRLGYLMDSEFYGTGYYIDRIADELRTMTAADVNAAVKKYLHPSNIKIVVVADEAKAQSLFEEIAANAPSPITYDAPKPQQIVDEDKTITAFPLAVNRANSYVVPAKELFEQ
jgi:zinc protease